MSVSFLRLKTPLACLFLLALDATAVEAQPPAYLTQWGSYGTGVGQFAYPVGVATDLAGSVCVVDQNNQRIEKFTSAGTFVTQWGSYGSGEGQFMYPFGVATDASSNVYVLDANNRRVEKFTDSGAYLTEWSGTFAGNMALATDAAGNVYVADRGSEQVWK